MKTRMGDPAESAGELYYLKTDVSPEQIFQAIGRLRKEARDEVDRLLQFLDKTDDYVSRELEDDSCENEEGGDIEPSLGSLDRAANQERWSNGAHSWGPSDIDRELDRSDDEPSLGAIERHPYCLGWPDGSNPTGDQTHWAAGCRRDLEKDPAESGIGDRDGLLEQVGTEAWQHGGMA
ncbi:hypothetical protein [Bradyrhizobium brasilense]|uniref:hypothetical protein n=1 Tax=Bradyrhizobium brasilense TaxID=1419277 RepID=UPI001E64E6DF|nr:hypothetical protein [Bradyrhizobium brasilense]MCC8976468.1 hypothetical protein [Bradyrhizobium brasilense]